MAFVDLTGRHAISVIGTAPLVRTTGGPTGGYTDFTGAGCLAVADPEHDFVWGSGPLCVDIIAWVNADRNLSVPGGGASDYIFDGGNGYTEPFASAPFVSGNAAHASIYYGAAPWSYTAVSVNAWHHFRYDVDISGFCRVYVDGVQIATAPSILPVSKLPHDELQVGGNWSVAQYFTRCKLAGLRITRASRGASQMDLSKTGSDDPLWSSVVLHLGLDPALAETPSEPDMGMYPDDLLSRGVVSSLFSWRRARDDDAIPAETRQGWWGDTFAPVSGDEWGSRLWLLTRENLTPNTLARAREYSLEALQWLIDDGVAARVEVDTEAVGQNTMGIAARIYRADGSPPVDIRFDDVWRFINA